MKLRCRLGLHKWVRVKVDDPTLDASAGEWETRCRFCNKPRRLLLPRVGAGTGQ